MDLGGNVAQLEEYRTGTPLMQVGFLSAARDILSPRINFQCRLSYGVRTPPCAIVCKNIHSHVRDPIVHVKVWWIMETWEHPACSLVWVAPLLLLAFPGKSNLNFPLGQYRCKKFFVFF